MSNIYNQAAGATKETLGNVTGNKDLADRGRKQWAEGKGEHEIQKDKAMREEDFPNAHRAGDSAKQAGGATKEKLGQAIGNDKMASEGRSQRAQGVGQAQHHDNLAEQQKKGY
ncbi:hypothetical protein J3B02_000321 [Coemansia erecta]|uniref:CsbD-like domain-containing protein n=1 Tax=Coemansia asiatica TaxID=1052880 RepID=A0A9W7XGY6_9FUNG|nr:hypothetical protein LPJ64_005559 [Coemansia asiatica]KAJ2854280.1 hypothetical protein FB639_006399 [Coemansia asiatica]KAJ2858349.1 hypothetical protein J3B02_000321 [Coemansia erecta]